MANLVADVASYQPDSLSFFNDLVNRGVKAVIVKITEGSNPGSAYVNPKAANQIANARKAGLKVHAYHFARFNGNQDAINEAKWFVQNAVKCGIAKDAVMVADVEAPDNATNPTQLTSDINAFIGYVKGQGFPNTDTYSMRSWFSSGRIIARKLITANLWIAEYGVNQCGYSCGTWQFTNNWQGMHVDMSYDYKGLYTGSSTGGNTGNGGGSTSGGWKAETGTFSITTAGGIKLRTAPNTTSSVIMILGVGQEVKYDAYLIDYNGYVWIRQPRSGGSYGYLATGKSQNGHRINYWGTFK